MAQTNTIPEEGRPKPAEEEYPLFLEIVPYVKGKPTCKAQDCYGRGYVGVNLITGALMFCHCATIDQAGLDRRREEREAILRGYAKMTAVLHRVNQIAVQQEMTYSLVSQIKMPWWRKLKMWLNSKKKPAISGPGYSGGMFTATPAEQGDMAPAESSS